MTNAAAHGRPASFYEGEFCRGVRHGRGETTLPNGDIIEGTYADGAFVGPGSMRAANGGGILEAAAWPSGFPDGPGSLHFPGGSRYAGEFAAGEMTGQGRLEHPPDPATGSALAYAGGFLRGRAHGSGVLTVSGGGSGRVEARLTGEWREGLPEGRALLEEPHGKRGDLRPAAAVDFADGARAGVFARPPPDGAPAPAPAAAPAEDGDERGASRAPPP
jgi:hypothetical protein